MCLKVRYRSLYTVFDGVMWRRKPQATSICYSTYSHSLTFYRTFDVSKVDATITSYKTVSPVVTCVSWNLGETNSITYVDIWEAVSWSSYIIRVSWRLWKFEWDYFLFILNLSLIGFISWQITETKLIIVLVFIWGLNTIFIIHPGTRHQILQKISWKAKIIL